MKLGDLDAAEEDLAEGLAVMWDVQDLVNLPIILMSAAVLAATVDDPVRAGTLWGATQAEAERAPRPTTTANLAQYEPHLEPIRGGVFEDACRHGRTLSLEEAVEYALGHDAPK
jgi:hypothetical protein